MQGRYGHDKLNLFIWIVAAVLYFVNLFVRSPILAIVILLIGALAVFRSLSKNITKRMYENNRFVSIYTAVADFFKRQYMKVRDFKTPPLPALSLLQGAAQAEKAHRRTKRPLPPLRRGL